MTDNLTNRKLLAVLWDRLPTFTEEEWLSLMKILEQNQSAMMKIIHSASPQIHHWIQEKHQQLEQEKTDKEVEVLKKSLTDKK